MSAALSELREHPHRAAILVACAAIALLHQWLRWDWFIDDAAIVFAYARTLVEGHGVVPWPGGERIEGFSDPTWWLLLSAFQAMGLSGFVTAKPLAMGLTVMTVGVVWRLGRAALPEDRPDAALLAPFLLALNPQVAIWSASGLENSLFCLLLAGAVHRSLIEGRTGGFPWSSVLYLLLAWTRPEGVLYAAVGGIWFGAWTLKAGRGLRPIGLWLAIFWIPTLVLSAFRLWYFAWPVPNTYYAKVESRGVYPLQWGQRGWSQLREYAARLWHGYYLPVYVLGLIGRAGPGVRVAGVVVVVLGLSLLWPGPAKLQALWMWPELPKPPAGFVLARIFALVAAGALLPFLAVGGPGWRARVLCWHSALAGLLFSVWANGDWMGAYRWLSLIAPVSSVLLATGIIEIANAVAERWGSTREWGTPGWLCASFGVGLLIPPSLSQTRDHTQFNRNETPEMIRRRSEYIRSTASRVFYDDRIVNLDMDMGGAIWFAPDFLHIDMAMLVDIPMGRHWYQQRAFIQEYVLDGARPDFAHVHGWWAKHSGFETYESWDRDYFRLPPYDDVPTIGPHPGMWARRELVMDRTGEERGPIRIAFEDGLVIEDIRVPVPTWANGWRGYVEIPVSSRARDPDEGEPTLILFLSRGDELHSWSLPMGYGLYPMAEWQPSEVFRGRHAVRLLGSAAQGDWEVGLVAIGADGRVLDVLEAPDDAVVATTDDARFAVGELRFPQLAVQVVGPDALHARAMAVRRDAVVAARDGRCDDAEALWVLTKRHHPRSQKRQALSRPEVAAAIAGCWAASAEDRPDDEAVAALARAHTWDHDHPELLRIGTPVARRLLEEGHAARLAQDPETAFTRYSAVLTFQPWHAWARRYAEEARDHRLGLTDDIRVGIGGADDLRRSEGDGGDE